MVKVVVLTGFGINCERETAHAFYKVGGEPILIHLNDLLENPDILDTTHIFSIPGGFSFGDDIASGRILANKLKYRLEKQLKKFIADGKLIIGICNGFQVMVKMGILPLFDSQFVQNVTLSHNDSGRFEDRWVYLKINKNSPCIWTRGLELIELPVRHGEGKFIPQNADVINKLHIQNQIVFQYAKENGTLASRDYPFNPNGSFDDIAGICDPSGRILGMMPHPEAFWDATLHPQWHRRKMRGSGEGLKIFSNGVEYAKKNL